MQREASTPSTLPTRRLPTTALAAAAMLTLAAMPVYGASLTWDAGGGGGAITNGAGAWLGANLWNNAGAAATWTSGDDATFAGPATAGGAVTLASPTTANTLTFSPSFTGTYTLGTAGQALTINNGITKSANSGAVTISSPITLGGAQSWTNNSGTALTVNGVISNAGFDLTVDGSGATTFGATMAAGAGGLIKNGSGRLTTVNAATAFTGPVTVNGGVLQYGDQLAWLTNGGNITLNGGVIEQRWSATNTLTQGAGAGQIQILGGESGFSENGSTGLTWNIGNVTWGSGTFNPSKFVLQTSASQGTSSLTFSSPINLNGANRTIIANAGAAGTATSTLSGAVTNSTGTAGLVKEGAGQLILTNTNTYNGTAAVSAGTLTAATTVSITGWSSPGNVSVASGATLGVRTSGTSAWTAANIDTLRANTAWASSTAALGIDVNSGTFTYASNVSDTLSIRKYGTGTLNLNGDLSGLGGSIILDGGTLGRSSGSINTTAIEVRNGTLSANVGGTTAITKTTGGTVILSGSKTFSGGVTLNAGSLQVDTSGATNGGLGTGTLTINGGQIRTNSGGTFTTANDSIWNASFDIYRGITGTATWNHDGDVTLGANIAITIPNNSVNLNIAGDIGETGGVRSLTFTPGGLTTSLSGNNTYSGGTTLSGGTLRINSATALGTGAFAITGGAIDNTSAGAVTLSTNNVFAITGNFAFTGTRDLSNGTGNFTINGTRTITVDGSKLTLGGNQTTVVAGGIVKAGAGTLALLGSGVQTGNASITGGTLEVGVMTNGGVDSSLGKTSNAAAAFSMSNGTTLRYVGSTNATTDRAFTINGTAAGHGATIESSGAGTLSYSGGPALAYGTNNQTRSLTLGGTNTGTNTFGKVIANNGTGATSLTKAGSGTWVLNQANTYTGATTVNAGTLLVNGSLALGSAVTVDGGTLGGSGSVFGTVTINDTGTLSPGTSIESLATGALTLNDGSTFLYELDTTAVNGDLVVASGAFNINDFSTLSFVESNAAAVPLGTKLTLINYSGAWNNGTFAGYADGSVFTLGANNWELDYDATSGGTNFSGDQTLANFVTITAVVPEPASLSLLALGAAGLMRRRRVA